MGNGVPRTMVRREVVVFSNAGGEYTVAPMRVNDRVLQTDRCSRAISLHIAHNCTKF